jgi:hypothetical protein
LYVENRPKSMFKLGVGQMLGSGKAFALLHPLVVDMTKLSSAQTFLPASQAGEKLHLLVKSQSRGTAKSRHGKV